MILSIIWILAGLALLFFGAEWLVKGATSLAFRLALTPLVVGLTVVAFGTSAPELVVSVQGALADKGGIIIGNVLGSNICNIGALLGLAALIYPLKIKTQLVHIDVPVMIIASLLLCLLMRDDSLARWEGVVLSLGILAYLTVIFVLLKKKGSIDATQYSTVDKRGKAALGWSLGLVVVGIVSLMVGADWLLKGAIDLATRLDVSESVIGLTIVALGTSVPEFATLLVATLRRQADIAVGNLIGSNIFNILSVLGVASLIKPLDAPDIRPVDFWVMIGMAILALRLMKSGLMLKRWEGGLFVVVYVVYFVFVWRSS